MSIFNKVLASVGIGAARVDTKLSKSQFVVGEEITGIIEVVGGNIEQPIDEIYLSLLTQYVKESDDKKYLQTAVIGKYKVLENFTISPNEKKEIPFTFTLPFITPVTQGKTRVWIHTGLDIKNAIDPTDKDFIDVQPLMVMKAVLNSVQELGFRLREVECEESPRYLRASQAFVQEFEFIPTSGTFRGKLDELEVVFIPKSSSEVEVYLQVDRKARGLGSFLAEAFEMDESNVRLTVNQSDIPTMTSKLANVIKRYS
ncbi:sporulation protein [Bacillus pinisoli]|uniref:sporulation protein n=1 Tax=Bacillus pinisoli TaxID=2901866 RepID=UPI001FF2721A|nr:sporulation protein [Bacillus pinisoli]